MRILVTTPYRASAHPELLRQWRTSADRLMRLASDHQITAYMHLDAGGPVDGSWGRFSAHARARNGLLDAIDVAAYDYLYWVDSDIVRWPTGLLSYALADNPDGVTSCAVTLDRNGNRFYDIWGFLEDGRPARLFPPWFDQANRLVELDSVGCCYIIPAAVYAAGARYADTPGATEHFSVCQDAWRQDRRVVANLGIRATHAYLPDYGEALH